MGANDGVISWQHLDWDSSFFGFGVGQLAAVPHDAAALGRSIAEARAAGVRLLYASCPHEHAAGRALLAGAGGLLVDAKRTYTMSLLPATHADALIGIDTVASPLHPCERRALRTLAWQAAEHSRFRVDPRLPPGAWRRMYSAWIAGSLDGRIAYRVLVARASAPDTGLAGMVTLARRNSNASIGLLAVHDAHRGRGLGPALVQAAAAAAAQDGFSGLSVITQGINVAACRMYESCGFALADEQSIFHLWTDR